MRPTRIATRPSGRGARWSPARGGASLARSRSGDVPQRVGGQGRSHEGRAVAQDGDERGQVLQLQAIVERVAEAMGPVEERQGDEDEEVEPRQRVRQRGRGANS